jgi:hypothetical protein
VKKRTTCFLILVVGCSPSLEPSQTPTTAVRDFSIYLRALTDDDPRSYLGRFVPDEVPEDEVDESRAVHTPCSGYVVPVEVSASERKDLVVRVTDGARVALGIPGVGRVQGGGARTETVRVHYGLTGRVIGKIQDADGFAQCCASSPAWCSGRYIGEFLRGEGVVYRSRTHESGIDVAGGYSGVEGSAGYGRSAQWERAAAFDDGYFAFRVTPTRLGAKSNDADDCGWADRPPSSSGGTYFVGTSAPLPEESAARQAAVADAQAQVVSYLLGESVERAITVSGSGHHEAVAVETVLKTSTSGTVRGVDMLRWCVERIPTPRGEHVVARVLGFVSAADRHAAKVDALTRLIEGLEGNSADPAVVERLEHLRRDWADEGGVP